MTAGFTARPKRLWVDAAIAVGVAVVLSMRVAVPVEADAPDPDWRAYLLAVSFGVVLLWRRRHPAGTLVATLLLFMAYYSLGFGAIGAMWPLAPALFNAALYDRTRLAALVAVFTLSGALLWRLFFEPEESTLAMVNDVLSDAALATAVILAGSVIVGRRRLMAEMERREQALAAEREAVARRRVSDERLHIAREVHDVVAHGLAGIGVQARLAEELVDTDIDGARSALRAVIDSTSEAMQRLRTTVGSLRDSRPTTSAPPLADLASSIAGIDVTVNADDLSDLPSVDAVTRAIVREALTNTVRHADAAQARVTVERDQDSVVVSVTDDGNGDEVVEGNGIRGMRERVSAAGGTLDVGPDAGGGFTVRAEIPT